MLVTEGNAILNQAHAALETMTWEAMWLTPFASVALIMNTRHQYRRVQGGGEGLRWMPYIAPKRAHHYSPVVSAPRRDPRVCNILGMILDGGREFKKTNSKPTRQT